MDNIDRTPQASIVDVPQPPDSGSGQPVIVDTQAEGVQSTRGYRSGIAKALVFGGVLALATVGPDVKNAITDHHRAQARAAIADAEKQGVPIPLQSAQSRAAHRLFGLRGDRDAEGTAQKIVNSPGQVVSLPVADFLPKDLPKSVKVSEDGMSFEVEGQVYGVESIEGEDGSVYRAASKTVDVKKLFGGKVKYAANAVLIGGAHNDASSDRNGDGVTTPREVIETANEQTRDVLSKVFPTFKIIVEGNKVTKVSLK